MYTAMKRFNAVGTFALSVAMGIVVVVAAVTVLIPLQADVSAIAVKHSNIRIVGDPFTGHRLHAVDLAIDLTADLSGLFHWNTRYLYVAVLAHYEQNGKINDVVVFDRVLHRSGPKRLRLQGQRHKYLLTDPFAPFLGQNVTYSLHCNIIPYAGALQQSRWGGNTVKVAL